MQNLGDEVMASLGDSDKKPNASMGLILYITWFLFQWNS